MTLLHVVHSLASWKEYVSTMFVSDERKICMAVQVQLQSKKGSSVELEIEHVQVNAKGIMSKVEFSTLDLSEKTAKVS